MKTVTIFWKGASKSNPDHFYLGVNWDENGFICKKFLRITEEKYNEVGDSGEISVPIAALL
jgi:hypothetical protein